jgi:hypothetical protein
MLYKILRALEETKMEYNVFSSDDVDEIDSRGTESDPKIQKNSLFGEKTCTSVLGEQKEP